MALKPTSLMRTVSRGPSPRMWPHDNGAVVGTFLNVAGAPIYAECTPISINSAGKYVVWAVGLAVTAFVYFQNEDKLPGGGVQIDATDDVQGVVLINGVVHYGDIVLPTGETAPNLIAALIAGPRELGLIIQGLPGAHRPTPDLVV